MPDRVKHGRSELRILVDMGSRLLPSMLHIQKETVYETVQCKLFEWARSAEEKGILLAETFS